MASANFLACNYSPIDVHAPESAPSSLLINTFLIDIYFPTIYVECTGRTLHLFSLDCLALSLGFTLQMSTLEV